MSNDHEVIAAQRQEIALLRKIVQRNYDDFGLIIQRIDDGQIRRARETAILGEKNSVNQDRAEPDASPAGKHTPGPWIRSTFGYQVLTGDSWSTVCTLRGGAEWQDGRGKYEQDYEWQNQEANATLIAAAPEMLSALKSLGPLIEEIHKKWDEGQRAGKMLIALMEPSIKYRHDISAIHAAIARAEGRDAP